MNKIDTVL